VDKIPTFTPEQVEYLNRLYPERCANPTHTEREIWRYVGAREVVRHINSVYEEQLERGLLSSKG